MGLSPTCLIILEPAVAMPHPVMIAHNHNGDGHANNPLACDSVSRVSICRRGKLCFRQFSPSAFCPLPSAFSLLPSAFLYKSFHSKGRVVKRRSHQTNLDAPVRAGSEIAARPAEFPTGHSATAYQNDSEYPPRNHPTIPRR